MRYRAPVLAGLCAGLLALGCSSEPAEPNRSSAVDLESQPAAIALIPTVAVNPASARIFTIGNCHTFSAYANGFLFPPSFDWESSNPLVASVTWSGMGNSATACGLTEGFTEIRATGYCCIATGHITSQPAYLEVGQPVRSVLVQPSAISVKVGATTQLSFAAVDQYGYRSTRFTPAWASLNPAIATVTPTGVVTGKALGKTTITARINGITGSATVTVGVANLYISGPGNITTSGWYTFGAVVSPSGTYTYKWTVIMYGHGVTQTFTINPLRLSVQAATGSLSLRVTVSQNGVALGTATKVVQNSIPGSCGGRKCP